MYMRNNRSKYSKYNIPDLPFNYSGQYTRESIVNKTAGESKEENEKEKGEIRGADGYLESTETALKSISPVKEKIEAKMGEKTEEKRENPHSLIGGLLKGGKGGGILSKLLGEKEDKEGGTLLNSIELEDLILLAVIFFLLKDGVEDDFLIILALILLA